MENEDELKPTDGESHDDLNQEDGDESDSLESLEALFSDDDEESNKEKEEKFLSTLNKATGKNFKSIEAFAKSVKAADVAFAQKGKEKKEVEKPTETRNDVQKTPAWAQEVYFSANPEARLVWPKVSSLAAKMGRDPFEVYTDKDFSFLKKEGLELLEETEEDEENKKKVKSPSSPSNSKSAKNSGLKLSDADRALLKRRGLSEKDVVTN